MTLNVEWIDSEREPQKPADPEYPDGIDLDLSRGAAAICQTPLPYPARRCGFFLVVCDVCHRRDIVTTAGRRDDPRSLKVPCKRNANERRTP